ncbi:MAG: 2-dehydropantoate 2-reductase [Thermodesulfobacteriota bacterium]
MNITIIGAGAMGSLFGYLLAQSGKNVLLIDIWREHVNTLNSKGLGVEFEGKTSRVDINASSNIDNAPKSDLVIVFVKSSQTEQAAVQALNCLNDNGFVLTLQNGMGNADKISQIVDPDRVIAGTTSHGATILAPGLIRHAGTGPTTIGIWSKKDSHKLENIKEVFCKAGIDTAIENDIHLIVWKKLIINVGINAITALTGIKNGSIVDISPTGELVRSAVQESCDVALAHGVELPHDIADQVFKVARATGPNRSSMGQDVDHKRQTEIDVINGAIVSLAQEKGIQVPVNQTLTALIKTMQQNYKE